MENLYGVLGVSQSASKEEIQGAYRSLAKKYHPDLNPGNAEAEHQFKKINEAYEVLKDPQKRKEYDQKQGTVKAGQTHSSTKTKPSPQSDKPFDFASVHGSFADFFGFDAKTGETTNEEKLKKKNPVDTSDLFERFMGFKG